jgi:putative ABC transport system permease protein
MLLNDWLRWVFHAVTTARLRSLLTALGISIGIASVTLLTSIGEGDHNSWPGRTAYHNPPIITRRRQIPRPVAAR